MSLPVKISHRAELDIADAADFIARDSIRSAIAFVDDVTQLSDLLAANPFLGEGYKHPRHSSLRVCPLSKFRSYAAFYQVHDDHLLVVRVLSGFRDLPVALDG